jgi:type IV pilus assembly protein PilC
LWDASQIINRYGVFLVPGSFLAVYLLYKIIRTRNRRTWDDLALHIPVIGKLNRKIAAYRFCQTLSELTASGVPINRSLDVTAEIMDNQVMQEAICQVREQVHNGAAISQALQESGAFSGMIVSMIRVGEESGEMEALLADAAEFSRVELEQDIDQFIALIEPAMIICIGVLVGVMVIGMMLPMYDGMAQIH